VSGHSGSRLRGFTAHPLLIARVAFTVWMAAWVPIILASQGPQNFWWLCNLAQFLLLYAVWRPSPLIASSQVGTVVVVGLVWTLDLLVGLAAGGSVTGITAYMFSTELPLIQRLSSTYHIWLPAFAIWLCWYQGYDRRGPALQCVLGSAAIVGGWWLADPGRNVNYATAPFNIEQVWLPHGLYIALLCVATAGLVYLPGHYLVQWILGRLPQRGGQR